VGAKLFYDHGAPFERERLVTRPEELRILGPEFGPLVLEVVVDRMRVEMEQREYPLAILQTLQPGLDSDRHVLFVQPTPESVSSWPRTAPVDSPASPGEPPTNCLVAMTQKYTPRVGSPRKLSRGLTSNSFDLTEAVPLGED
jgi:hypothetical protein